LPRRTTTNNTYWHTNHPTTETPASVTYHQGKEGKKKSPKSAEPTLSGVDLGDSRFSIFHFVLYLFWPVFFLR
jgi:hypothetical protein